MLVLRVLENVLQPSFLQKMTVLSLLENICHDPNLIIDIFVNFDCDVESPNIFERYWPLLILYLPKIVFLVSVPGIAFQMLLDCNF